MTEIPLLALHLTTKFLSFALLLQGLETFSLCINSSLFKIWSFENLKADLKFRFFFSDKSLRLIAILQVILSLYALIDPAFLDFLGLFLTSLIISIRFRGTFNGGSDMMTFVILTGVLIGLGLKPEWGLIYISIHTFYSYFKAGVVKVIQKDWRSGQALPIFLQRSLYPDIQRLGRWLQTKKKWGFALGWLTMIFELGAIGLLFFPQIFWDYFAMAMIFHFIIYLSFGLNRFFWIWLCGWPSLYYAITLLQN